MATARLQPWFWQVGIYIASRDAEDLILKTHKPQGLRNFCSRKTFPVAILQRWLPSRSNHDIGSPVSLDFCALRVLYFLFTKDLNLKIQTTLNMNLPQRNRIELCERNLFLKSNRILSHSANLIIYKEWCLIIYLWSSQMPHLTVIPGQSCLDSIIDALPASSFASTS